ncbi:siderophore-interacting protein [Luteimicrobium subarcticum]|uniref:NADPH-dependent ferric siderophore reductase n=1 Tax=Luteimicrobium subarcticum TaxID=620910 RepID=A0A2M8W3P6_9MICO|nr:siderophore-interacting protein [Luteimicrobium subarcticum]PJI85520.1 NADPH-dependent ferric siderophore reductase [Luteimicrobium subarcticum]
MSAGTVERLDTVETAAPADPWRLYDVQVARTEQLSPTFVRVTFTGEGLEDFDAGGLDQRVKLVLPATEGGYDHLPRSTDWYTRWRALPDERRCTLRTYTVRAVRRGIPGVAAEVDIDFALHGESGPASRWALAARPGDRVVLWGPDARHGGPYGGIEFAPGPGAHSFLVVGDETAVPAVSVILAELADWAVAGEIVCGEVLLEVPCADDVLDLVVPPNVTLTWVVRDGTPHGDRLVPLVHAAADRLLGCCSIPGTAQELPDVDIDAETLWEVPVDEAGVPLASQAPLYAWLAGEAAVIRSLRRHLVSERGVDRKSVAFMGYWREGRPEN